MSESKHAKIVRLLGSNLPNARLDESSDDPTVRGFWNCFALLGVPEDTRPDQVPGLASKARQKAKTVLEGVRKSDADAGVACAEFVTRYSTAAEHLGSAAKAESHLKEIRERRMAVLRDAAKELALAGASDPTRALLARAEKLGFLRADRRAAVDEALAGTGQPQRRNDKPPPDRTNREPEEPVGPVPRVVRAKVGAAGLLDLAPLVVSGGATALVLAFFVGGLDPNLLPRVDAPAQAKRPAADGSPADGSSRNDEPAEPRVPVVRDVAVTAPRGARDAAIVVKGEAAEGERLQYQYRIPADSPAWAECEAEFTLPLRRAETKVEFRVVDSTGQASAVTSRTLPARKSD